MELGSFKDFCMVDMVEDLEPSLRYKFEVHRPFNKKDKKYLPKLVKNVIFAPKTRKGRPHPLRLYKSEKILPQVSAHQIWAKSVNICRRSRK